MGLTATDYLRQMQALLPPGPAWPKDDAATLTHLLSALSAELARVDGRALMLVEEADPRTVAELFADWERVAGLPDACAQAFGGEQTLAQHRGALVGRLTTLGGQSPAYYIAVSAALGYEISITEFFSHTVESDIQHEFVDDEWRHVWRVNEPASTIGWITVDDSVDEPLSWWGIALLECVINRLKPAHTDVLWAITSYSDGYPAYDIYEDAAVYGSASTVEAIDRLHVLLQATIPTSET